MGIDDLIGRLDRREKDLLTDRLVLCPLLTGRRPAVHVMIDGYPFRFRLRGRTAPGWRLLRPRSNREAEVLADREPQPWEIAQYLEQLPSVRALAIHPLGQDRWLAYPQNMGAAAAAGWPQQNGMLMPAPVQLVEAYLEPFDVIVARRLSEALLFDQVDRRVLTHWGGFAVPETPEERVVWDILLLREEQLAAERQLPPESGPLRQWQRDPEMTRAIEERRAGARLREALAFMGGEMQEFQQVDGGYVVRWRVNGEEFHTTIDASLFVQSAGICLAGRDYEQSLSSIVPVMRRFMDEQY